MSYETHIVCILNGNKISEAGYNFCIAHRCKYELIS